MRKVLSLALGIILLSSNLLLVNANDMPIDEQLLKNEFPLDVINEMVYEQKMDILNRNLTFCSTKQVFMNENKNIMPMSVIPSDELMFRITTATEYKDGEKFKVIYLMYDWEEIPYWKLQNLIGVSWDGDYFRVVSGEYRYYCQYKREDGKIITKTDNGVCYSSKDGVGWDIDIKGSIDNHYYVIDNYGFCSVTISKRPSTPSDKECELYAKYIHIKGSGSIGLSFGPLSVSFSGGASTDSRGTELFEEF